MACLAWQGRFGVTREDALKRAKELDNGTHTALTDTPFPPPKDLFRKIRTYLIRRSDELDAKNNPIKLLRFTENSGVTSVALGPEIDKGSTPEHFHFDSGARLSFGLTLREHDGGSQLVSYRFHYHRSEERSPEYFRFDLNPVAHEDPLSEPRCHLHPGLDDVRIPFSLYDPFEILDRIFFGLEESL